MAALLRQLQGQRVIAHIDMDCCACPPARREREAGGPPISLTRRFVPRARAAAGSLRAGGAAPRPLPARRARGGGAVQP
eukprot:scaffold1495_cov188-Prasinococcus_capsulatus_cf.AAC.1